VTAEEARGGMVSDVEVEILVSSVAALSADDVRNGRRAEPGHRDGGAVLIEHSLNLLLPYGCGLSIISSAPRLMYNSHNHQH